MIKYVAAALVAAASAFPFITEAHVNEEYHLTDMTVEPQPGVLNISVKISPTDYRLKTNQRLELTPVLRSLTGGDSIVFPSVIVAGRNSFFNAERNGSSGDRLLRSGKGDVCDYAVSAPWADWMEYSEIELICLSTGCCGVKNEPERKLPVAVIDLRPEVFTPTFHYKPPKANPSKDGRIEGSAFVNFPVNRTEIYPDYMVNPQELKKITSSVDSVRLNPYATVTSITLTGFASPEGSYKNNVRLAKGRTEAVKEYVRQLYTFPPSVFHTKYVPEDWDGLRMAVDKSTLPDRDEILDFIDNGHVDIEHRNDELRRRFPKSYAYLLKNIYPSLRHTNYAIDYSVKIFTDVEEIKHVMVENPQNLSLNEFFLAANSYPIGSPEYDHVFELAVLYYPTDEVANLNAANSAMNEGDYARAAMLLNRVHTLVEGDYARGVLHALHGDYDEALSKLKAAHEAGVSEAADAIEQINRVVGKKMGVTYSPAFLPD